MHINEVAKLYVESNIDKMQTMEITFSRFDHHVRYPIENMMPGIYFIYRKNGLLAYIGETKRCIKKRISRHKRSMNNPEWNGEKSGIKFHRAGIQDEEFVLKYIPAADLGLSTKHNLLAAEGLFVEYLQPIVYE